MTACVNNQNEVKGGVSHKVLRSVVAGVLAVSMVPTAAMATEGTEATTFAVQDAEDNFKDGEFGWNVEKNDEGKYVVTAGDAFYLTSVKDVFGEASSVSDVTVVYKASNGAVQLTPYDTVGTYTAIVIDGVFDLEGKNWWTSAVLPVIGDAAYKEVTYSVVAKSLEGSYFYEGMDVKDTSFKYTGKVKDMKLADSEGNPLVLGEDYKIVTGMTNVVDDAADFDADDFTAGTHTVVVEGMNDYQGSLATLKYTVDAIDLAKDVFTIDVAEKSSSLFNSADLADTSVIYVNGEKLADGVVVANKASVLKYDGGKLVPENNLSSYTGDTPGIITLDIVAPTTAGTNFVNTNASASVTMTVVSQLADAYYGVESIEADWSDNAAQYKTFVTSKGEKFDESAVTAWVGNTDVAANQVKRTVTVTKNGEAVEDCTEPGTYELTVEVAAPSDFAYGAKITKKFVVVANQFSAKPKVYSQFDENFADKQNVMTAEYTGEELVPQILVKAGDATLVEGTDYTVTYENEDGDAVESPVEPGDYTAVVDFLGATYKTGLTGAPTAIADEEVDFTISKATIESAVSDRPVYDCTGEAVTPVFTAYTNDDLTGLSVEIDPSKTPVTYYKATWTAFKADGKPATQPSDVIDHYDWAIATGEKPIKASNLKDPGFYIAKVTVPSDDAHFQGTEDSEAFEISETAGFSDVSSSDWFADSVYKAKELGYINGIQGTTLFAPLSDIERCQIAAIMFNMAGGAAKEEGSYDQNEYPTKFDDVDQAAWYAQAVAWASTYGVVNGYDEDTFGTFDKATREQVAAMFYNYAKAMGQDVTVEDEAAALAKVSDADTVSGWAKTAVAWAIENGVMGNGGYIAGQDYITRAEVAAMAVNFQPEKL